MFSCDFGEIVKKTFFIISFAVRKNQITRLWESKNVFEIHHYSIYQETLSLQSTEIKIWNHLFPD